MSILKVPSTQVLMSGRGIQTGGKAGSARRGHENSGNIPVNIVGAGAGGIIAVTGSPNSAGTHTLAAGEADVGAYQFKLAAVAVGITNQTITITCPGTDTFGGDGDFGGIVVEHLSTLGTETATMAGNLLTKFPGYGSVAFNADYSAMTYQRSKGKATNETMGAVNVYIRLDTQTVPLVG